MSGNKDAPKPKQGARPRLLGEAALKRTIGGVGPLGPDDLRFIQERVVINLADELDRSAKGGTMTTIPKPPDKTPNKPNR